MKLILLILTFFISGCANNHFLNVNNVQTISYDNVNLDETDFDLVLDEINKLNFKEEKIKGSFNTKLQIISNEKIYNLKLYNNNIFYEEDNKTFVADNTNNLNLILENLKDEYTDFSFFNISYHKCESNNNFTIKIDNTNNCITLNTEKTIYNFKINSIEATEDFFVEDSLLYQKDEIKSNTIKIKTDILTTPKFKISFETEHNYVISMLPIYNQEENKVIYNISHKQKK